MCCTTLATGACSWSLSSNLCPGLRSPIVLSTVMPRTNVVTYCSLTSSPFSVRHSSRIAARVPFSSPWYPIIFPRETSLSPGRIGRWKWKSCSPWTIRGIASTGITSTAGVSSASKTGTIANTGGATSPLRCASMGSLVAAAYSANRSCVTSNSNVSVIDTNSRGCRRQRVELVQRLVELLDAVLLDRLAQSALDHRALEVAENREFGTRVVWVDGEGELGLDAGHAGSREHQRSRRVDLFDRPLDLVGHPQHDDLGRQLGSFGQGVGRVLEPLLVHGELLVPVGEVGDGPPQCVRISGEFAACLDVSHDCSLRKSLLWLAFGPLIRSDDGCATESDVVLQCGGDVVDLPLVGLTAQLPGQLGTLRQTSGPQRMPLRDQFAGRVDHPAPAVGDVAVVDQLGRLALGAQPQRLVEQQLVGREAVVQLDHLEVRRPQT